MFVKMNGGKAVTDANLKAVAETYLTKTVGLTAPQINALKQKLQERSDLSNRIGNI